MSEKRPDLLITPNDFPAFLKARVSVAGSVAALAEELGVTTNLIYMLLGGERKPSMAILTKLGLQVYFGFTQRHEKK